MIGISKPADAERFNEETVKDPTLERVISFEALGQAFSVRLEIPAYIHGKLLKEDWDFAEKVIRDRAEELRRQMALAGSLFDPLARGQIATHVNQFARTAIYNQ